MMSSIAITLFLLSTIQSATTLAAVAIFNVNAERKWPVDDREPAVTAEALRLLEVAAKGIADDRKIDDGKVRQAIADFTAARTAFERQRSGDATRPGAAREALREGRSMIDAIADALDLDDQPMQQLLSDLKRTADSFDKHRPVRQQADVLEKYFHAASQLAREMVDAPKG
jgi:hypothetical protein